MGVSMVGNLPALTPDPSGQLPVALVLSVQLVTGQIQQHAYPIPSSQEGVAELVKKTIARIDDAFNPETSRGFVLENPVVIYNLDNVISIGVDGLSNTDLSDIARGTEKTLGFVRHIDNE